MLEDIFYVPTLGIRPSEMTALEYLPGATKARMCPCCLLAPWMSANTLEKAVDRFRRAYPQRNFILDLDRDYERGEGETAASAELEDLKDPAFEYQNWRRFCDQFPTVSPCLQLTGQSQQQITQQIGYLRAAGKTFVLRIVQGDEHRDISVTAALGALEGDGASDYAIILEAGWVSEPLQAAAWLAGMMSVSLTRISAQVPIVVSFTTMPKEFSWMEGIVTVPFSNRTIAAQIQATQNARRVVYGDWGSTRPREPSGFRSRPLDRIDYPTANSWVFARKSSVPRWDYRLAAIEIINRSRAWAGNLDIWGEEMIAQTAVNPALGINNPAKSVAARINIHLHQQAFFNAQIVPDQPFEDPWTDDL